jgi:hypothetical protein
LTASLTQLLKSFSVGIKNVSIPHYSYPCFYIRFNKCPVFQTEGLTNAYPLNKQNCFMKIIPGLTDTS